MKHHDLFPPHIQHALGKDAPGAWMPPLPDACIRLSAGYPAPSLVPSAEVGQAVQRLISTEHDLPFHYLGSPSADALPELIRRRMRERGMPVQASELLVTAGGCQAIDLVARVLLDASATVFVEAPTYMEALEMFRNYTDHIVEIPVDDQGLNTDVLAQVLDQRKQDGLPMPRLLYTIPSFHNPTGLTLPDERRRRLLELAEAFDFLIVEDDAYGELSFAAHPVPLKARDNNEHVLYIGSLSKVVAPGLRVGWLAGPTQLVKAAAWFKKDLDHPFAQAAMAAYLSSIDLGERVQVLQRAYRDRRDVMLRALAEHMPDGVTWHVPDGGFFVWLHTPGVHTGHLLARALQAGVAYVPGQYFFVEPNVGVEYLRLSFSYLDPDTLVEGVRRLAAVIQQA